MPFTKITRLPVGERWCLHSYYTVSPYAPDGSGRILAAGADLETGQAEVLILSAGGEVLDRFGRQAAESGFYHTGWWQTWSPDARYVYYQAGSLSQPRIGRREVASGEELFIEGDMEGAPPTGEPILSGLLGMLYAAGYGENKYRPERAPVPFAQRDQHGIFEYEFAPARRRLKASIADILERHLFRDRLVASDREIAARLGSGEGLTLMAYCVRWSPDGSRLIFHFGNHCVVPERGEPRLSYVMTTDRDMKEVHVAMDLSYGKAGVHWSWQPDNQKLIGYGPHPDDPSRPCLAEVNFDGSGYRMLSEHASGGHPSVRPTDPDLIVTDEGTPTGGAVLFLSRRTGKEVGRVKLWKFVGSSEPPGRNPQRVCHHPVFHPSGDRVICNHLPSQYSELLEIKVDL